MTAYYNEHDIYAAQWLRNLIAAGHIAPGDVDERSIEDVRPSDLAGYTQCHFFAGIGVWSLALRRAGWPDDRPVWTGSCPCQPFSAAGQGLAFADERHLWPAFGHLIKERSPVVVYGEQVASKDADDWIDLVQDDLESMGYAVGALAFPSAGVGAPHIRDRMYWVADANYAGPQRRRAVRQRAAECAVGPGGVAGGMANANGRHPGAERQQPGGEQRQQPENGGAVRMADADSWQQQGVAVVRGVECDGENTGRAQGCGEFESRGDICRPGPTNGLWRATDWIGCTDGKWRPVEPGTFPLVDGAPSRVVRLRAYGNGIVSEVATEFIKAVMS